MKFKHYRKSYQGWRKLGMEEGSQDFISRHHRGGGSRGGIEGKREGKRRFFERGEFKFALLELLASAPMHGYQLIKAMEEKTGGLYTPSAGSVYPNLQLLEDMNLIGFREEDGKKLYHLTDEGKDYLQQSGRFDAERSEKLWERRDRDRHRASGKNGKRELRGLMDEWSEVIYLMAKASNAAQENPSSKQAKAFQELMTRFKDNLNEIIAPTPTPGMDETAAPQAEAEAADSVKEDNQVGE